MAPIRYFSDISSTTSEIRPATWTMILLATIAIELASVLILTMISCACCGKSKPIHDEANAKGGADQQSGDAGPKNAESDESKMKKDKIDKGDGISGLSAPPYMLEPASAATSAQASERKTNQKEMPSLQLMPPIKTNVQAQSYEPRVAPAKASTAAPMQPSFQLMTKVMEEPKSRKTTSSKK